MTEELATFFGALGNVARVAADAQRQLARLMQRFDEFAHGCAEFRVIFLNFAYVWPRLVGSSLEPESGG